MNDFSIPPSPDREAHPHHLIAGKAPAWMRNLPPDTYRHLRTAARPRAPWFEQACLERPAAARALVAEYGSYRRAQEQAHTVLASLPPLQGFACEQLTQAIEQRFGLRLDVTRTYLINASKAVAYKRSLTGDPLVDSQRALKLATQSLLHCALQNFEAAETHAEGLDVDTLTSRVVDSNTFLALQPLGQPIAMAAPAFAALVRELDIGGQYQTMIDAVYAPSTTPPAPSDAWQAFSDTERSAFRLQVHMAFLTNAIDESLCQALLKLADDGQADYLGSPIRCAFLEVFGVTLTGAMAIGVVPSPERLLAYDVTLLPYKEVLITYLPGAPAPLMVHTTSHQVQAHVSQQISTLPVAELRALVPERHQHDFLEKTRQEAAYWVAITLQPLRRPFVDALVHQKYQRLKDDARFHAVPTALEDQKTTQKRISYFSRLAFNAINVGAFFVPGLGQLMMGLSVIQLSYEVFEGFESWADGDRDKALDDLLDVLENLALTAALGAAGRAAGTPANEKIPVERPSFITELKPVELPDGQTRLWLPDLRPFAHDIVLPADLQPDEFGVYQHQGKMWLALEDQTYSIRQHPQTNDYHLEHPRGPERYQPRMLHNGAGAWLQEDERPREWQGLKLFRRLGHLTAAFDDQAARQIMQVSGTSEDVLRRVLAEREPLPALLQDTLLRFKLDHELERSHPEAPPHTRATLFEQRYAASLTAQGPRAELVRRVYPTLPRPVLETLLLSADEAELQALDHGKIPGRLGEEIRCFQHHIRLARAYEGLYLRAPRNWDSERLILHTLAQLPGWRADLRVVLEQRRFSPGQVDSIGPRQAALQRSIICARAGYIVGDAVDLDQEPVIHDTLYDALYEALTPSLRQALALDHGTALRQKIQAAPLLARQTLREVLGMRPARPGYTSPMRLADGRLGYPLSGMRARSGSVSRHSLLNVVRQLGQTVASPRAAELILSAMENSGMSRSAIQARLQQLRAQNAELQDRLNDWHQANPTSPPQRQPVLDEVRQAILQYWYDTAFAPAMGNAPTLRLQGVSLHEIPTRLPDFFTTSVRSLELVDTEPGGFLNWRQHETGLSDLLRQFSGLRALTIQRGYTPDSPPSAFALSLPLIAEHLRELESLSLLNQNIAISAYDVTQLAQLPRLRRLDLSGNRLADRNPPDFSELELDYLGLERLLLDHWPLGLNQAAMTRIREISLRDNSIRTLPALLLEEYHGSPDQAHVSLQGNTLIDEHVLRVLLSEDGHAERLSLSVTPNVQESLTHHLAQRRHLREVIDQWANASGSSAAPNQAVLASRNSIATALNAFWHAQEQGRTQTTLRLDNIALHLFPTELPGFFTERVRSLALAHVSGTTAQLERVLRLFPQLSRLTLDDYLEAQRSLPLAITHLTQLTDLTMRNMGFVIDQQALDSIGRLTHLVSLDLSGNRLGAISEAPATLQGLRRLDLNSTGLTQWPDWVNSLLPLDLLELSDNRLTELPPFIVENAENDFPISSISLYGNPLTNDLINRARTSSTSSYTFALDLPDHLLPTDSSDEGSIGSHLHIPVLDTSEDAPNVEDWLHGTADENQALKDTWQQLDAAGDAQNLLALVGRLRRAAPYRNGQSRQTFSQRVRMVLVKALVSPDNRALFNAVAQEALVQPDTGNQTCHDGALLVFQNLELLIANQELVIEAADSEENLYRELRRLYRLHELDTIARRRAAGRDEAEVRLAYRYRLSSELDLGVPLDRMLYEASADVHRSELDNAITQVQNGERGEAFLSFAADNARWVEHLRQAHVDRFAAIEQAYQAEVTDLPDRFPGSTLEALEGEFEALARNKLMKERNLIRELTIRAAPDRT